MSVVRQPLQPGCDASPLHGLHAGTELPLGIGANVAATPAMKRTAGQQSICAVVLAAAAACYATAARAAAAAACAAAAAAAA